MKEEVNRSEGRLIIASNRLPIRLERSDDESWRVKTGSGGLVTAMVPVLEDRGGAWVGWTGLCGDEQEEGLDSVLQESSGKLGFHIRSCPLSHKECRQYYYGFANEIIWPMFHDLQTLCNFDPDFWNCFRTVNHRFARIIADVCEPEDYAWIHDYHLMGVGSELRGLGLGCKQGFFLHIPFPPLDIFVKLPWRLQVLEMLLDYDLIGFQSLRDRRNFLSCVRAMIPGVKISGRGQVRTIESGGRSIRVGAFPISIDFRAFVELSDSPEVRLRAEAIRQGISADQIILGVDRLDYTKGIPYRLSAFRRALEVHPELRGKVSLIQVVAPSRTGVQEYKDLLSEIEQLVSHINGRWSRTGWVPVHYIYRGLNRNELVAHYRAADIALVTPLKDGMNLIAKEYCAAQTENQGLLILSEFAGTAAQFQKHAFLVNPYHIEQMAETIHRAVHVDGEERASRMRRLRQEVRKHDIFWWVDSFLRAAFARKLEEFPRTPDYIPGL